MEKMFVLAKKWILAFSLALLLPTAYVIAEDNVTSQETAADGIVITVNVNTASAEEISTLLLGIGLKKAQAIVDYRSQHGAFTAKEDLTKVKGIGVSTVKKNEDRIQL